MAAKLSQQWNRTIHWPALQAWTNRRPGVKIASIIFVLGADATEQGHAIMAAVNTLGRTLSRAAHAVGMPE